jgi:hypothetical protein
LYTKDLKAQNIENLQGVTVISKINPEKLMKRAAEHFCRKKAKIFMSEVLQYRAVKSGDTYLEFNALNGIIGQPFSDMSTNKLEFDNNQGIFGFIVPINVLRSNAYGVRGEILDAEIKFNGSSKEINYYNSPMYGETYCDIKRLVELFSPLNPKMVKWYNYKIIEMYKNKSGEDIVKIYFDNKNIKNVLKHCKLISDGTIIYNISKRLITKIILNDFLDYYNIYCYAKSISKSISSQNAVLTYIEQAGIIYPEEIILNVKWNTKQKSQNNKYYSFVHPRKNPSKYNISLFETIRFLRHREISNLNTKVRKALASVKAYSYYSAPFNKEYWDSVKFNNIDIEKVKHDLNRANGSLYRQSEANSNNGYNIYIGNRDIKYDSTIQKMSTEIYKAGLLLKTYIIDPSKIFIGIEEANSTLVINEQ